jgi:hypothetical protein
MVGVLIAVTPAAALGHSAGITTNQFGATGCNQCHFGGNTPTVTLSGPATVAPGSTNEYTLQVFQTASQNKAGLNVSALSGMLATGGANSAKTQVLSGTGGRAEVTHTSAKAAVGGVVTFSFLWTAPASFSSVTLNAWGNAVNGNGTNSGDAANIDSLVVLAGTANTPPNTATPTSTTPPTSTATRSATTTATSTLAATPTRTVTATATPSPTASNTPSRTPTKTVTASATPAATGTQTPTQSATATPNSTNTPTNTVTRSATATATVTPTVTSTRTATRSATGAPTASHTPSATAASSATLTVVPSATATDTSTGTPTGSASSTFTQTPSETPTATATSTGTATGTPTATLAAAPICQGDCNGDGQVTIDELLLIVNVALGDSPASGCPAAEASKQGGVSINEVLGAVNSSLNRCGS